MNELILNNVTLPVLDGCDLCAASEDFFHTDRIVDFNVLIYVIEGKIYVTEDETDFEIGEGELLILKSGCHHYGKKPIPKGTRWYFIHFFYEEKSLSVFEPDSSPLQQYSPLRYCTPLPKKLTNLCGSNTERLIGELIELFHSDDTDKKWRLNFKLASLLSHIALREKQPPSDRLSDRICRSLNSSFKPFSAKALEQEFFLSYKYMAAVFKKERNMTMQQYHTSVRMNEACRLLKSTLKPIGEISELVGYGDMLYFSRCFHKHMGVSPSEYRKTTSLF